MNKFGILFFLMLLLLFSRPISAEEVGSEEATGSQQDEFDALVGEAVQHYSDRRYEQAIELFERAFEIRQEPELVYNIARSHERLAHREEALEWYERFITMPGTTGELRTRALSNITALRQELAALNAAQLAEQQQQAATQSGTSTIVRSEPRNVSEPQEPARPLRVAGYSLISVGAATMIVGGIFGGLALSAKNDFDDVEQFSSERVQLRDDLELRSLVADILLFSGLGVAAAGAALVIVDAIRARRPTNPDADDAEVNEEEESAASVAPGFSMVPALTIGNGEYGFGIVGRF